MSRIVEVHADWRGLGGARLMGHLHVRKGKGEDLVSFEYDRAWLQSAPARDLDPRLQLFAGPQYPKSGERTFGLFQDSAPDRFGRTIMRRREAQAAREESRARRTLTEIDYLLGVHDQQRMGALRFRKGSGPFLDDRAENAAPPFAHLRELAHASRELEREGIEDDPRYAHLLTLLAPGSSLGGARPKSGVVDPQGALWIAKFPSSDDPRDTGAWEAVTHALAKRAGIVVADAQTLKLSRRHRTFLTRRFDRAPTGDRIHFASAMTMLDRSDGDDAAASASYLELADFLVHSGARVDEDLEQLWRRIVFFMCVSNVDDHLRNHGFILDPGQGWRLSPAYDMNPDPTRGGLKLNVSESDNTQSLELALEVAEVFRLKPARAKKVIGEVTAAAHGWRAEATRMGLPRAELEDLAPAFRLIEGS